MGKGKKAKRWALGIGIPLLIIVLFFAVCNYTFSEGSRSGYLIKMSKKGFVFKTFEGQINMGGVKTGELDAIVSNQIFEFSVLKKHQSVYADLERWQGKYVKIFYKEILWNMPWQGDTKYFIHKVELVE